MSKISISTDNSSHSLGNGVRTVTDAIRVTLGPKGRNAVLQKVIGSPLITNDGKSIAKEIDLQDPIENMGAQLIKEVANKTSDAAGNGTTTACVLANAIIQNSLINIEAGANPILIKRGIDKAVSIVTEELEKNSININTKNDIYKVASISANDKEVGLIIANIMDKVGNDGIITIEEGQVFETTIEVVDGMQFDRGYVSPLMITNDDKREAILDKPYILITDKTISQARELLPILEKIIRVSKQILIIAEDVVGEALATLNMNKMKGFFICVAVRTTGFGERRKAFLEDVSVITGGQIISEEMGLKLENATLEMLGKAHSVKIGRDDTTIIGGAGNSEKINSLLNQIKKHNKEPYNDRIKERITRLSGKVGIIKVGAATEIEMKEKKMRFEGALSATKAAIEEGLVPGGGTAFINAIPSLDKLSAEGDELTGINIIKKALEEPMKQIANNASFEGNIVVEKAKEFGKEIGLNAVTGKFENMISAGIIDPTKVVRSALQYAASVASMLLTTGAIVSYLPEKHHPEHCNCGHHHH